MSSLLYFLVGYGHLSKDNIFQSPLQLGMAMWQCSCQWCNLCIICLKGKCLPSVSSFPSHVLEYMWDWVSIHYGRCYKNSKIEGIRPLDDFFGAKSLPSLDHVLPDCYMRQTKIYFAHVSYIGISWFWQFLAYIYHIDFRISREGDWKPQLEQIFYIFLCTFLFLCHVHIFPSH